MLVLRQTRRRQTSLCKTCAGEQWDFQLKNLLPGPWGMVLASGQSRRNAIRAAAILGGSTLLGVALTSVLESQLQYALPLAGGVTLYVAGTDLLPEINREPNWRVALLVFAGVAILLILQRFLAA